MVTQLELFSTLGALVLDFSDFFDSRARSPQFDRAREENLEPGKNTTPNLMIILA